MTTLLDCIYTIPQRLNDILDSVDEYQTKLSDVIGSKHIVIVGSGSSYNTAQLTKFFAEKEAGIQVDIYYPNIFLNYTQVELLNKYAVYIFISQSGQTKLVYESLLKMKKLGYKTISITEKMDSSIARAADISLDMGSKDEPYIFRTIGYSSTVLVLYLIYIIVGELGLDEALADLKNVISQITEAIQTGAQFYKNTERLLSSKEHYIFAGAGESWAIAEEANIKFMEMIPTLTNCFELEELIHGPQNMFNTDQMFFLINHDQEEYKKSLAIKHFIEYETGANVILVGENANNDVVLNVDSNQYYSLVYISFFQTLAYYLATAHNRDLSSTMFPNINNYINKKI